jgi:uncharacterized protein (DUF2141 family)
MDERMKAMLLVLALTAPAQMAHATEVSVVTAGVTPGQGHLLVSLCPEANFLKSGCSKTSRLSATAATLTVTFQDVAPGRYAASVVQDLNDNGRLDFEPTGAPSEPWGMSRDPEPALGPPSFEDAAVAVTGDKQVIQVHLQH